MTTGQKVKPRKYILHLKSYGFISVAAGLKMFLEAETGKIHYRNIDYLCTICLKTCVSKRKVTKFFTQGDYELTKEGVQKQVTYIFNM